MNKFLSKALSAVNSFLAILIIIGSGLAAMIAAPDAKALAFILGIGGGFIVAIIICGVLAVLINIREEIIIANKSLNDLKSALSHFVLKEKK